MNTKDYPSPKTLYPIKGFKRLVYLNNIIKNPQIIVGDYTYYDDAEDVYNFEKNVLYLFDFIGDKLINRPVCLSAFNARLSDMVQIGPVWTPPKYRNRGFARLLLTYTLQHEKLKGTKQAIKQYCLQVTQQQLKPTLQLALKKLGITK